MTIHAAKGLEFPIVTVPDLGTSLTFGRSIDDHGYVRLVDGSEDVPPLPAVGGPDPDDAFSVEKTAAHEYADRISRPQDRAEAKRLLYVACTRARDRLLLCGTHDIELEEDGGIALGEPDAFDEAGRWRDWLQPALFDDDLATAAFRNGSATGRIGDATYTVRSPSRPVEWKQDESSDDSMPSISMPAPSVQEPATRVAATTLVNALADEYGESEGRRVSAESRETGLQPTTFGTVVHRLAELRPSRDDWESFIEQVSRMVDDEPTVADVESVVTHADDAISFVESVERSVTVEEAHDEYSVIARLDGHRIVGDIDRLLVTPDTYWIIDY